MGNFANSDFFFFKFITDINICRMNMNKKPYVNRNKHEFMFYCYHYF